LHHYNINLLIYNNDLAKVVESLGYKTILAEGADKILGWRSPIMYIDHLVAPS
jgi:alpha-amylase/alpha-mannosidase (GH57 family)